MTKRTKVSHRADSASRSTSDPAAKETRYREMWMDALDEIRYLRAACEFAIDSLCKNDSDGWSDTPILIIRKLMRKE